MTRQDQETPNDADQPIKRRKLPPFPPLPEREWLNATIIDVAYRYSMRQGVVQYVTNKDGENVIDQDTGLPIKRTEFSITFYLRDYTVPNDQAKPRQLWLQLGNSLGEKAHLPKFLANCSIEIDIDNPPSPAEIQAFLLNLDVRLQVGEVKESKTDPDKRYQNVIWDAVKAVPKEDRIGPLTVPAGDGEDGVKPTETTSPVRLGPDGQELAWDE